MVRFSIDPRAASDGRDSSLQLPARVSSDARPALSADHELLTSRGQHADRKPFRPASPPHDLAGLAGRMDVRLVMSTVLTLADENYRLGP